MPNITTNMSHKVLNIRITRVMLLRHQGGKLKLRLQSHDCECCIKQLHLTSLGVCTPSFCLLYISGMTAVMLQLKYNIRYSLLGYNTNWNEKFCFIFSMCLALVPIGDNDKGEECQISAQSILSLPLGCNLNIVIVSGPPGPHIAPWLGWSQCWVWVPIAV